MVTIDKFFEVLLVDGAVMYNVYTPSTGILVITYKDTSYTSDLSEFITNFPSRKKYTLQTYGLYLFACHILNLDKRLAYETIVSNYMHLKGLNGTENSNLISLLLISVPSFLLPAFSDQVDVEKNVTINSSGASNHKEVINKKTTDGTANILLFISIIIVIALIYYIAKKK